MVPTENTVIYYIIFLLGASFGSFLNVVIARIPMSVSIISPSSHCYSCNKKLIGMTISLYSVTLFYLENVECAVQSFL